MAKKPVITAEVINEFGRAEIEGLQEDGRIDAMHTPGFTDMRKQRDVALREFAEGERAGPDVPILPVNVRLARNSKVGKGDPDSTKMVQYQAQGYRAVKKEDIGKPWMTELPPGTTVQADGTLRKGDLTYIVCDQKTAARNRYVQQAKTMRQVEGAASAKLAELKKIHGESDPTFETLPSKGPIKRDDVFKKDS